MGRYAPKTVEKGMMRKTQEMTPKEWLTFLKDAKFLTHNSMTLHHVGYAFQWCKMLSSDEVKDDYIATKLRFTEFLEALCILADLISVPTEDDISYAQNNGAPGCQNVLQYQNKVETAVADANGKTFTILPPPV